MRACLFIILPALAVAISACGPSKTGSQEPEQTDTAENRPQPPPGPPYPKAVVNETEFDFGAIVPGESGTHDFTITNAGDYPLEVVKGRSSCTCTVSGVSKNKLKKGETATITLKWKPKQLDGPFQQHVEIYTNDPDKKMRTILLKVKGVIANLLTVAPEGRWSAGAISGDKPATVEGRIFSVVRDTFEITSLTCNDKSIVAAKTPMTEAELAELKAKSGYRITVTIKPEGGVGAFSDTLKIKTDLKQLPEVSVAITGSRTGSILILPEIGTRWRSEAMRMYLGRFPAAKGAKGELRLFVSGLGKDDLKIVKTESKPEFLQAELTPVKEAQTADPGTPPEMRRKVYRLEVRVPPGTQPVTRVRKHAAVVTLFLNHKRLHNFTFHVEFDSY